MKPNRRSTWGYHASKAWYLSHSPNHYRCIRVLMADTGGERITDTSRFCHQAIPVPSITAKDRILDATARLTATIEGVQEAPPEELATIQTLRTLLLGEVPPTAPTPPQVHAPRPIINKEPVIIWSPDEVQQPARNGGANSPMSALARVSNSPTSALARVYTPATSALDRGYTPAIIEDDSDDKSLPPTPLRRSPRSHATPSTTTARICLHTRTAHMINCVIANHILTEAQLPPQPPSGRDMCSQCTYSNTTSYTPLRTHQNTSPELSSTATQVTCWNIDIS